MLGLRRHSLSPAVQACGASHKSLSGVIGKSRTRLPVALNTALTIAAAVPVMGERGTNRFAIRYRVGKHRFTSARCANVLNARAPFKQSRLLATAPVNVVVFTGADHVQVCVG